MEPGVCRQALSQRRLPLKFLDQITNLKPALKCSGKIENGVS